MRYLKLSTSKAVLTPALTSSQVIWQLVQMLWVGSLFLTHFLLLPALQTMALAPMLVQEVAESLRPVLVGLAVVGVIFQLVLLMQARKARWLSDLRGWLLLSSLVLAAVFYALPMIGSQLQVVQGYCYLALSCVGLLLLVQPFPAVEQNHQAREN